jgi:hypothetical protein
VRFIKKKPGDIRIRSGFLLFPKTIENETRFLEYAIWSEKLSIYERWIPHSWKNQYKIKLKSIPTMKMIHKVDGTEED